jgi:large subunit ribosomal protein L21
VLLIADGENITTGRPYVDGARVMATVNKNGKGEKITVFKYKAKVRYRRKKGHRQLITTLNIDKILPPGVEDIKPATKKAAVKKAAATKPVAKKSVAKPARRKKTEVKKDGA